MGGKRKGCARRKVKKWWEGWKSKTEKEGLMNSEWLYPFILIQAMGSVGRLYPRTACFPLFVHATLLVKGDRRRKGKSFVSARSIPMYFGHEAVTLGTFFSWLSGVVHMRSVGIRNTIP